jgi:hypothetical protein
MGGTRRIYLQKLHTRPKVEIYTVEGYNNIQTFSGKTMEKLKLLYKESWDAKILCFDLDEI